MIIAAFQAMDSKYQTESIRGPDGLADDVIISSDTLRENRLPPNQTRTKKWPVLDATGTPAIDLANWQLRVFGRVDNPLALSLEQFQALPRTKVFADFHCVTQWSRLGNVWEGVSTRFLLEHAGVNIETGFVVLHAYDNNWTTNLPLDEFLSDDALLSDMHDGELISPDHGGPVRAIVPKLYAWKSAKWICGVEVVDEDQPGYWERVGYHNHGDPWSEERFEGEMPESFSTDVDI